MAYYFRLVRRGPTSSTDGDGHYYVAPSLYSPEYEDELNNLKNLVTERR